MLYLLRILIVTRLKTVTTLETPAKVGARKALIIPDSGSSPE
jgi:hypothetical protein